jgi:hypothetical protein
MPNNILNPQISDLADPERFELLEELHFDAIIPFVSKYYTKHRSWVTWLHYTFSIGLASAWLVVGFQQRLSLDGWLTGAGAAVLAFFILIIPLHEWIHGLTYQAFGAPDVRYGILLRQMAAYAIAHHFVANRRQFAWVALAPFVLINLALALAALILPDLRFTLLALLLAHTGGAAGDFAILNYLWLKRRQEIFTYDDADQRISYLYARTS